MPKLSFELLIETTGQIEKVTRSAITYFRGQGVKHVRVLGFDKREETTERHWSLKYDRCVVCGTTERKHMGNGLCSRCYFIGRPKKAMRCMNPTCPYQPGDYRREDMIEFNGKLYCSEECQIKATQEVN